MRSFFVAATLLLITAGVFAGKARFFDTFDLSCYNSSVGYINCVSSTASITFPSGDALKVGTSGQTPASISSGSLSYTVYELDATTGNYLPVLVQ